ncbi:MAG: VCBS repeat-containing protein [Robiginitomaculum sp.]|nr:VCBS repeat-containing protein [Robiginitomaculum sp.]
MRNICILATVTLALVGACTGKQPSETLDVTIANTPSQAQTIEKSYISWREHLIDSEDVNGGLALRGGDGLKLADMDGDGYVDIVSVHEDSNHLRIAFGTKLPHIWELATLAYGQDVKAIEDVALGDINGDGWLDIVAACEQGHILYLQNPGALMRTTPWPRTIPTHTKNKGSWLRVFLADIDSDGQLEVLAANKGGVDIVDVEKGEPKRGSLSLFKITGDPLDPDMWHEQSLWNKGVPNTAIPLDIDRDGDIDILTGSRLTHETLLLLKDGDNGTEWTEQEIKMTSGVGLPQWSGRSNVFHASPEDLNHDMRTDILLVIREKEGNAAPVQSLGWLQQPERISDPWPFFRIGDVMPDIIVGFTTADIDNDGDLDVIVGGYSGLNVLDGGYSGDARDKDDPNVTAASTVGRISWFENLGDNGQSWKRHDISRRVRGMYDEFIARDMDGDGDIDFVGTRGNSGAYDGVFWLEQVRTKTPKLAFTPARKTDSRQLTLPPPSWRSLYKRRHTTTAPQND